MERCSRTWPLPAATSTTSLNRTRACVDLAYAPSVYLGQPPNEHMLQQKDSTDAFLWP
jgi:hypothetical protein